MKILVLNGPNLNMLGIREPGIYGSESFDTYIKRLRDAYPEVEIDYFQSNVEGVLIDKMQAVGFVQWKKRGAGEHARVRARRLDGRGWLIAGSIFLAGSVAAYFILSALDKTEAVGVVRWLVLTDALSMMCNVLGQWLLSTAYMEQWIFWIGVNVASVAMWVLTLRQSPDSSYALIYVVKYSFYLLNSLNGLRIWMALSRPDADTQG